MELAAAETALAAILVPRKYSKFRRHGIAPLLAVQWAAGAALKKNGANHALAHLVFPSDAITGIRSAHTFIENLDWLRPGRR
jgi:hypothetical protein